ncbi:CHASE2 domain-containing protein [Inquilinus sp.]|jgi:adenylate cyclase|uniref:CHASE2 domain-containing protein n=1 Tax=Inquilinus sp. TaxID=1932117 RepID=UPI00378467B0
MAPGREHGGLWLPLLLAALLFAALLPLGASKDWQVVENRAFDLFSTYDPPLPATHGAVIVAIDEPSFAEIGRQWPWPRGVHARLAEALRQAGARPIGFDIVFAEPSQPAEDAALAAALADDTVLAADITAIADPRFEQRIRTEPMAPLLAGGARSGVASVDLDPDGVLRRLPNVPDPFAGVLARLAGHDAAPPPGALLQYFGPPRSYPTVSYYQALQPATMLPPGLLAGKAAIVGFSLQAAPTVTSGGADAFATPYTVKTGRLTAGAEVQATILDNLAQGLWITPAPPWLPPTVLAVLLLAALAGTRRLGPVPALAALALLAIAIAASSYALLRFGRVWLPPVLPALGTTAAIVIQGSYGFAREQAQRRRVTRAFEHYLAPSMVSRLAQDPGQLQLGGETRVLTVLFCDVRGFTTLSERMQQDPQGLTRLLNRILTPLSEAVLATGGTIDKFIGDCVMAFWNAPLDDPDHAAHAIEAARRMLTEMAALNQALRQEGMAGPIAVGIGINTGTCVVGNMGSAQRFDYSALGDSVNLASRLEGACKRYGVGTVIGPDTARELDGRAALVELDRLVVKGRREPVAVFTLLAHRGVEDSAYRALTGQHAAALAAYRARRWAEARAAFLPCREIEPSLSALYDLYARRIAEHERDPPPEGWAGETIAAEK